MKICQECGEREVHYQSTGECARCYKRRYWREHYRPEVVRSEDRRDPIGYAAAHYRVTTLRGRASSHECTRCGNAAQEWSYTPGDEHEQTGLVEVRGKWLHMKWSPNPHAYEALCVPCHRAKDDTGPRVIEREHPSFAAYQQDGCRCVPCVEFNREYQRAYNAKRKNQP